MKTAIFVDVDMYTSTLNPPTVSATTPPRFPAAHLGGRRFRLDIEVVDGEPLRVAAITEVQDQPGIKQDVLRDRQPGPK